MVMEITRYILVFLQEELLVDPYQTGGSWGTYIFEQGADGAFPTTPTMLWQHANGATGLTRNDNFRPSSYQIADVDGDGKNELITTDRGMVHLTIDALLEMILMILQQWQMSISLVVMVVN